MTTPPTRPAVAVCLGAALALLVPLVAPVPPAVASRTSPDAGFTPQFRPSVTITRVAEPIRIDGLLDDAGWAAAERAAGFTEYAPRDLGRPRVDTEALFAYDDDNLYVAIICHDDSATVRASRCERDRIWTDDYVIVMLDTYASQNWAYEIGVNPLGIQGDILWSATSGEDMGYDLIYRSAGRRTADGWQAELAIPFASLRFPNRAEQAWRVNVWRNRPRASREQYTWAAVDRDEACWACQWGSLAGLRDVHAGRGLEVLPAFTARQEGSRRDDGSFREGDLRGEPSVGLRYSPTSSLTAEATVNPDFSQVESDAAQIDANTTFALSYPEKRPFFLEGAELFDTWFNTVYTRSINDPEFAFKLTGRPGRTSMAVLSARDARTPIILPFAERSGFVDAKRSWTNLARVRQSLGEQGFLGLIATDRRYDGGGAATLGGVDGRVRLSRTAQVEAQVLLTRTAEPNDTTLTAGLNDLTFDRGRHTAAFDGETFNGHAVYAGLEQEAGNWGASAEYWERSPGFRADTGFEPRNDQRLGELSAYWIRRWTAGLLEWVNPSVTVARMWDFTGLRKDEWVVAGLDTRLRAAQTQVSLSAMRSNERFGGIGFDGIRELDLSVNSTPSVWLSAAVEGRTGHRIARHDLVMGHERAVEAVIQLRPVDRLVIETSGEWTRSDDLATDARLFDGYVARTKLYLQLSRELSTRLVAQFDDFNRSWELDPLVTYRLNPFSIFYVGSTRDYLRFAGQEGGPESWRLGERSYFLKLQYLFRP
ncbi:MAG: carbohydrate binding family 9 domain-containing protein [Candidatus Krumholzibacteriia bacterium]